MSALPSQQAAQHATSAPAAFAPPSAVLPAPPLADAVGEAALAAHAAAATAAAQGGVHAAASAPASVPPQPHVAQHVGAAELPAAPAASVSMSGQGDTPGGQVFGTGVAAMPQSSAAAAQQAAGALQEGQGDMALPTDARSRQQGEGVCVGCWVLRACRCIGCRNHVQAVHAHHCGHHRLPVTLSCAHALLPVETLCRPSSGAPRSSDCDNRWAGQPRRQHAHGGGASSGEPRHGARHHLGWSSTLHSDHCCCRCSWDAPGRRFGLRDVAECWDGCSYPCGGWPPLSGMWRTSALLSVHLLSMTCCSPCSAPCR